MIYTNGTPASHRLYASVTPMPHQPYITTILRTNVTSASHQYYCWLLYQYSFLALALRSVTPALHQRYTNVTPALHQRSSGGAPAFHQCCASVAPVLRQRQQRSTNVAPALLTLDVIPWLYRPAAPDFFIVGVALVEQPPGPAIAIARRIWAGRHRRKPQVQIRARHTWTVLQLGARARHTCDIIETTVNV